MADSDPFRHIRELARSIIPGTTPATEPLPAQTFKSSLESGNAAPDSGLSASVPADDIDIPRRRGRRPERDDTTRRMAAALKRARLRKGTTQRDLGQLIGVPQSHISKIEAGGVDLRISSLVVLARALDLSLELTPVSDGDDAALLAPPMKPLPAESALDTPSPGHLTPGQPASAER